MKKVIKYNNRKKAFLGAIIGGVASIAGSAIGAAKQRKIQREQLKQQQIEQNQNDARAQAQALTAGVADQEYVDQYNKKITLKMGGNKKFNDRVKQNKNKSKQILKCGGSRKKALFGANAASDIAGGVSNLASSLFTPNNVTKQVKKADGFSTTGPKVDIQTPSYIQNTDINNVNQNTNQTVNPNNTVNSQPTNGRFGDRSKTLRCGGRKAIKRK